MKDSDTELEAILQNDWARFSELLRSSWHPASTQDSRSVENEVEGQKQSTSTTEEQLAEETDCEKQLSRHVE